MQMYTLLCKYVTGSETGIATGENEQEKYFQGQSLEKWTGTIALYRQKQREQC